MNFKFLTTELPNEHTHFFRTMSESVGYLPGSGVLHSSGCLKRTELAVSSHLGEWVFLSPSCSLTPLCVFYRLMASVVAIFPSLCVCVLLRLLSCSFRSQKDQ